MKKIKSTSTSEEKKSKNYEKYPPMRGASVYKQKWAEFIDIVVANPNFNTAWLSSLDIVCDLYDRLYDIRKTLNREGTVYEPENISNGLNLRTRPELFQMSAILKTIRLYSKELGLLTQSKVGRKPAKEKVATNEDTSGDSWD